VCRTIQPTPASQPILPHDRPLTEVEFVAFDLETTGLFPVVNRIVEFGAVRFTLDGRELAAWEQLVDPECVISPEVTDIHGITDAMVRGQPTVAQALPGFLDFLGGTEAILPAHNAMFDLGFLNFAAAKTGLALPANLVIDTLDLARTCVRGAPAAGWRIWPCILAWRSRRTTGRCPTRGWCWRCSRTWRAASRRCARSETCFGCRRR
jgi:DNA polymerase III epsilon subunit-like protein